MVYPIYHAGPARCGQGVHEQLCLATDIKTGFIRTSIQEQVFEWRDIMTARSTVQAIAFVALLFAPMPALNAAPASETTIRAMELLSPLERKRLAALEWFKEGAGQKGRHPGAHPDPAL